MEISPTEDRASPPPGNLRLCSGQDEATRAQPRARTLANGRETADPAVVEQQERLDIQCTAEHGYLDDPTSDGSQGRELGTTWGLTAEQLQGYRNTSWGTDLTSSKPYNGHDAGCHARSVHLTGQDGDH